MYFAGSTVCGFEVAESEKRVTQEDELISHFLHLYSFCL